MKKLNEDEVTNIDPDMIAEIDLHENAVYVVCNGKIHPVDTPPTGYGTQVINWQNGDPTIGAITYKQKFG